MWFLASSSGLFDNLSSIDNSDWTVPRKWPSSTVPSCRRSRRCVRRDSSSFCRTLARSIRSSRTACTPEPFASRSWGAVTMAFCTRGRRFAVNFSDQKQAMRLSRYKQQREWKQNAKCCYRCSHDISRGKEGVMSNRVSLRSGRRSAHRKESRSWRASIVTTFSPTTRCSGSRKPWSTWKRARSGSASLLCCCKLAQPRYAVLSSTSRTSKTLTSHADSHHDQVQDSEPRRAEIPER